MGNCLISQAKVVKIMKLDGKILEYRPSIKVNEVLSGFKGHAVSEMLPALEYLQPDRDLEGGHMYYLIPLPAPSPSPKVGAKKKVRFSEPDQVAEESEGKTSSFRIKLVVTKQELREMLESGIVTMDGVVPEQQDWSRREEIKGQEYGNGAWKPALISIPEVD